MCNLTAVECEITVTSVNDGSRDYYLRLSRLIPEYNVVQLKKTEKTDGDRRIIDLGVQTDSVGIPSFMRRVDELRLDIELTYI